MLTAEIDSSAYSVAVKQKDNRVYFYSFLFVCFQSKSKMRLINPAKVISLHLKVI